MNEETFLLVGVGFAQFLGWVACGACVRGVWRASMHENAPPSSIGPSRCPECRERYCRNVRAIQRLGGRGELYA